MRKIIFGKGDNQVQIGQETVCFRHEEKFHSPAVIAVTVSDKLNEQELRKRIETINSLQFERIGIKIGVQAIAVINDSGSVSNFAKAAAVAGELGNSAAVVHRHYRELVKPADALKWFAVAPDFPANMVTLAVAADR